MIHPRTPKEHFSHLWLRNPALSLRQMLSSFWVFKTPFPPKQRTVAYSCVLSTQLYAASTQVYAADTQLYADFFCSTRPSTQLYAVSTQLYADSMQLYAAVRNCTQLYAASTQLYAELFCHFLPFLG